MTYRTILLTGGTGFLGSHLARHFLHLNSEVILLKRTTSKLCRIKDSVSKMKLYNLDEDGLEQSFKENKIDYVVHCATNYGRSNLEPLSVVEANLTLPLSILIKSIEHKVKAFINTDTILDKRIGIYSMSKKQFYDWMSFYSQNIACVNVALEHFFGPGDDPTKFVSFLIQQILKKVKSIDLTPGEQKRDFIFIEDVIRAFEFIIDDLEKVHSGLKKYEVGTGQKMRLKDFANLAKDLANNTQTQLNFGALPYRSNEVMDTQVNLEALLNLGWAPLVSTKEGLEKTIVSEQKMRPKECEF